MRTPLPILTGVFALALMVVSQASADWPGFRGNPQLTGVAVSPLTDSPKLLWTYQTSQSIESTAAIVGSRAYVGSIDSLLHAVDIASGERIWVYQATDAIKSSPLVSSGVIYFGDETGVFHAVDAITGERVWTYETEGAVTSSAVRVGDRVLFGSYDNRLYCVDATGGSEAWKLETDGYVHAAPTALGDTAVVVSGCDAYLRLVDVASGSEIRRIEAGAYVASSLAVSGTSGYVGTFGNVVLGVDLAAGAIVWEYESPDRQQPYYASAAVSDGVVVIGGRDRVVHAVNARDGSVRWTHPAGARVDASPVIYKNDTGDG